MSEHDEQCALLDWASRRLAVMPELAYLFAVPNGGRRARKTANALQAEGLKAGVPDVFLPVARQGQHGFWIEFKVRPNKPTKDQARWLAWLAGQGYRVEVSYGWQSAAAMLESYLGLPTEARTEFWE